MSRTDQPTGSFAGSAAGLPVEDQRLLDAACDAFEARWRAGARPDVLAAALELPEPVRPAGVRELVQLDAYYRRQAGEVPTAAEYASRFPDLTSGWLAGAVAPAGDPAAGTAIAGRYTLLERIGAGGMGAVYRARQSEPVKRFVAVKLIKAGMDSEQVLARFEAERQALALMDHPNIAKVLDGGLHGGRPFFVMELVKGTPITDYCDANRLTPRQRLELFVQTCQAVQHAHQKGVIHRDVKPSNVLVALYDDRPVVKVIDFGVAKATGGTLTDLTLHTGFGVVVGTPQYMSPEQAGFNQLDVDTRSDIYALGVLLYELLTGGPPFSRKELEQAGLLEMLRVIREREPSKPSTKLGTAENLPTLAANRGTEPAKLARLVRGEMDWIVMKALEKDRGRRYETASGFARDIQRYLNDEPVQACPPSAWYRLRKAARRNRAAFWTAGVVAAAMVTATLVSAWQARRATEAEGLAENRLLAETQARNATREQLLLTRAAEAEARKRLYHALVARAQARRLSQRIGQRFESLDILDEATGMARDMKLPAAEFARLRNEVIACLALPDLRVGREWEGWTAGALFVEFDAALQRYARADRQGAISVRRVTDDTEICSIPSARPGESYPLFSPDGRFLTVGHPGYRGELWDLTGPAPVRLLEGAIQVHAFRPDSRQYAQVVPGGTLELYDLPSGRRTKQLRVDPDFRHLAFHPSGHQLAASRPNGIQVLDLLGEQVVAELAQGGGAYWLAWHPDGNTLAAASSDRNIYVWDVAAKKQVARLEGHKNDGIKFSFSHAGGLLASAAWDGVLRLWDPRTGQQLFATYGAAPGEPHFSPDDRLLAAGIDGSKLRLWEVASADCYLPLARNPAARGASYHTSTVHPGGRLLAVGTGQGTDFWDLATGQFLGSIGLAPGNYHGLFEPSGALLTNGPDGLRRWPVRADPESPGLLRIGPPQALPVPGTGCRIARSSDGRVLASGQHDGGVVVSADAPDRPVWLRPHADVRYVAVSPDGGLVATGSHGGTRVKIWPATGGEPVKELPIETGSWVDFSPDGMWLATTGGGLRLWAVDGWQPGPEVGGWHCAFSPDSRILAADTGLGAVRLIDPASGREYARLEDPDRLAAFINFTPDGTRLVITSTHSDLVRVWDLRAVRRELAKRDLDWGLPPYPPAPAAKEAAPLRVEIDAGDRK